MGEGGGANINCSVHLASVNKPACLLTATTSARKRQASWQHNPSGPTTPFPALFLLRRAEPHPPTFSSLVTIVVAVFVVQICPQLLAHLLTASELLARFSKQDKRNAEKLVQHLTHASRRESARRSPCRAQVFGKGEFYSWSDARTLAGALDLPARGIVFRHGSPQRGGSNLERVPLSTFTTLFGTRRNSWRGIETSFLESQVGGKSQRPTLSTYALFNYARALRCAALSTRGVLKAANT